MPKQIDKSELLRSLRETTLRLKDEVLEMSKLDSHVLLEKPKTDSWNVLECIEHLNIADAHYLREFDKKLVRGVKSTQPNYNIGLLGGYFVKSITPRSDGSIPNPMKTLRKFRPEVLVHDDTFSKFIEDQDELINVLEVCKELDLQRMKITSAIGRIITFRLGDALRFVVGHNERHVIQAKNALKSNGAVI